MASARLSSRDSAASRSLCLSKRSDASAAAFRRDKRALRRRRRVPATALQRLSIGVSFGREQSPVFIRGDDERVGGGVVVPVAQRGGDAARGVEFHGQRLRVRLGAPRRVERLCERRGARGSGPDRGGARHRHETTFEGNDATSKRVSGLVRFAEGPRDDSRGDAAHERRAVERSLARGVSLGGGVRGGRRRGGRRRGRSLGRRRRHRRRRRRLGQRLLQTTNLRRERLRGPSSAIVTKAASRLVSARLRLRLRLGAFRLDGAKRRELDAIHLRLGLRLRARLFFGAKPRGDASVRSLRRARRRAGKLGHHALRAINHPGGAVPGDEVSKGLELDAANLGARFRVSQRRRRVAHPLGRNLRRGDEPRRAHHRLSRSRDDARMFAIGRVGASARVGASVRARVGVVGDESKFGRRRAALRVPRDTRPTCARRLAARPRTASASRSASPRRFASPRRTRRTRR